MPKQFDNTGGNLRVV